MSLISLGYIFTYYFLLISSYSLSHFFSRQALRHHRCNCSIRDNR
ncbi:hypothetical protein [Wolbachia endosymbiont of Wiebesia pumilae]|nr:hypothetical protein [Wolbachia endosymbiont of Wiebesia pumilae]